MNAQTLPDRIREQRLTLGSMVCCSLPRRPGRECLASNCAAWSRGCKCSQVCGSLPALSGCVSADMVSWCQEACALASVEDVVCMAIAVNKTNNKYQ